MSNINPSGREPAPEGAVKIQVGAYVVLIDEADLELISGYAWRVYPHPRTGKLYASSSRGGINIMMHRLIAQTPEGLDTDHANNSSLDNQRANLRYATRSQNNANREKHSTHAGKPTSSRYKGVTWDREKRRWRAAIRVDRRAKRLGRFVDEIEAARAYDRAALDQWGDRARVNFPNEVSS